MASAKRKKTKGELIKSIIVAVFLVGLVLFYFNSLSNKSTDRKKDTQVSELTELEEYDMVGNYPNTARDVVKLHCRYLKVLYGQELSDEDISSLNQKTRSMYSSQLLMFNSESDNLLQLKTSISNMKEKGYTYKAYKLPEASQIKYYTQDNQEMATLEVAVTINTKEAMGDAYVQYVLVKENDEWKIYAWGESQLGGE